MTTVGDLGESALIARIQAKLPPAPPWVSVGIGDDGAIVEPERNRLEVLSVDTLVESVHFDRAFVPPDAIGHRSLAVNLSDLAAMGAAPRLALLAMALPPSLPLADFDAIVSGFADLAGRERVHVVGGNLTRSPGPLMIDVTVAGTVKRRQTLTRAGARPGDEVYVSGTIGGAAAGLLILTGATTEATDTNGEHRSVDGKPRPPSSSVSSVVEPCIERYLRPEPRLRLGIWLGRNRVASACIDLSDGLADGAHRIAEASGVGIALDADTLPLAAGARAVFEARGGDALDEALAAGDDYELLFTVRPRRGRSVAAAARHAAVPLTKIGVCTPPPAVVMRRGERTGPVPRIGYSHFAAGHTSAPFDA